MVDGESARGGLVSVSPLECDPPIETNRHSPQGHSGGFFPKRHKFLCDRCFEMVGARPSMRDTFDGCGFLAQIEREGV